jgi:hypothetical protein
MNRKFNKGDRIKFNEGAVAEVRGKTGTINKFLESTRLSLARLEQGKPVYSGLYIDVNMWEVILDESNALSQSPEDWLDRIV